VALASEPRRMESESLTWRETRRSRPFLGRDEPVALSTRRSTSYVSIVIGDERVYTTPVDVGAEASWYRLRGRGALDFSEVWRGRAIQTVLGLPPPTTPREGTNFV
jgi:hypothetical protein